MKRVVFIFTLIFSFSVASCQQNKDQSEKKDTITEPFVQLIEKEALKKVLADNPEIQLVDVRTPGEFERGTIAHAVNIDFRNSDFESQIVDKCKKDQPIYVFCMSGGRSGAAAKKLETLGFKFIYDLDGGYSNWNR